MRKYTLILIACTFVFVFGCVPKEPMEADYTKSNAVTAMDNAQKSISDADATGADVADAQASYDEAKKYFDNGDFFQAELLADRAKDEAEASQSLSSALVETAEEPFEEPVEEKIEETPLIEPVVATPVVTEPIMSGGSTHVVGSWSTVKECLWNISIRYYNTTWYFGEIFEANSDKLTDPRVIFPGQTLILPDLPKK